MTDGVIKGSGNSRYLKTVQDALTLYPTYESFLQSLISGTLPIDLNGINAAGWETEGTALNKANLLSDATAAALGLDPAEDPTVDEAFLKVRDSSYTKVGDLLTTVRTDLGEKWLLANGSEVLESEYPELYDVMSPAWHVYKLASNSNYDYRYVRVINVNGAWYVYGQNTGGTPLVYRAANVGELWSGHTLTYTNDSVTNPNFYNFLYDDGMFILFGNVTISSSSQICVGITNDASTPWTLYPIVPGSAYSYSYRNQIKHNNKWFFLLRSSTTNAEYPTVASADSLSGSWSTTTLSTNSLPSGEHIIGEYNGTLFAICPHRKGTPYFSLHTYNDANGSWGEISISAESLPWISSSSPALSPVGYAVFKNTLYVIGGLTGYDNITYDGSLYAFKTTDFTTWTYTKIDTNSTISTSVFHRAIVLDDTLYLLYGSYLLSTTDGNTWGTENWWGSGNLNQESDTALYMTSPQDLYVVNASNMLAAGSYNKTLTVNAYSTVLPRLTADESYVYIKAKE